MNGVVGMTELLLDTELSGDQKDCAETIQCSADALLRIINDILDYSKIEAGRMELEAIPFDPVLVAEEAMELVAPETHGKDVELIARLDPDIPRELSGDPGRLRQVLINLLGNASKFTSSGEISLTVEVLEARRESTRLEFTVADTGIGIPKRVQATLFDKFSQADGSTTRRYGGTGLGLAICKQLVELMGGEIEVASVEGQGSTFSFSASFGAGEHAAQSAKPVRRDTQEKMLVEHGSTREIAPPLPSVSDNGENPAAGRGARPMTRTGDGADSGGAHARVLLVEDNPVNQVVARRALQTLGCRVDLARDGQECIDACRTRSYDAIFMDCQMPVMDGYEATRIIRQEIRGGARIPIIAMTANAMQGDRDRCLAAGMDHYVSKPFKKETLAEVLRVVLADDHQYATRRAGGSGSA